MFLPYRFLVSQVLSFGRSDLAQFEVTYMSYWQMQRFLWYEFVTFPFLWLWAVVTFFLTGWMYVFVWIAREFVTLVFDNAAPKKGEKLEQYNI